MGQTQNWCKWRRPQIKSQNIIIGIFQQPLIWSSSYFKLKQRGPTELEPENFKGGIPQQPHNRPSSTLLNLNLRDQTMN